jgi:hypothetical protein
MLVAVGLLMSPAAYHRIVVGGHDTREVHHYIVATSTLALFPFAVTLGSDLYLVVRQLVGGQVALWVALVGTGVALVSWYGVEALHRRTRGRRPPPPDREGEPDLTTKIREVLTEARVVLPGAQALLGFQFVTMLSAGFQALPRASQLVHLASLLCIALSTILLMTPAAYHRIVEEGEDTERFHRLASALVLAAMVPLALGVSGDLYVVTRKVLGSHRWSLVTACAMLLFFFGLWFGYTLYQRRRRKAVCGHRAST